MSAGTISTALFAAFLFAGWPILGKYSQVHGTWIGILITIGTLLVLLPFSVKEFMESGLPPFWSIGILTLGGIVNGVGIYFYTMKISNSEVPVATFVVIVAVFTVIFVPILDWLINGTVPNSNRILGYLFAIPTIYILGK